MEIALDQSIPTYGGGLGILAGDMLRSAADLELPMVAVTLAYRKGYFRQHLDEHGYQTEESDPWSPEERLQAVPDTVTVRIEDREVIVRAWRYDVHGLSGFRVPVYLLDCDVPENSPWDRTLTDTLYGGDQHYRICQEVVLGIGGIKLLRNVGLKNINSYHMNEGHARFLLWLCSKSNCASANTRFLWRRILKSCGDGVFSLPTLPWKPGTTDFPGTQSRQVLGEDRSALLQHSGFGSDGVLNMTHLACISRGM